MSTRMLAGDIGGTKTVLAIFDEPGAGLPIAPLLEKTYPSNQYDSLDDIVRQFMAEINYPIAAASFGVAGPVVNGRSAITNLPWVVETSSLQKTLSLDAVTLLNDLESIANAVPYLAGDDIITLQPGTADPTGTIGVIAPGTGLGEAYLTWTGSRYESYPSEGGHTSFGPATQLQQELLIYMWQQFKHVSYERVCSGSGIPNLYNFFKETGKYEEPAWLAEELSTVSDKTPTIVRHALAETADICVATLNLFIEILAGEAANMALKLLATGGIYLGGGIPPRIIPQLQASNFRDVFANKGRFGKLLSQLPVMIICNPKVALYGAAYQGLRMAHEAEDA